MSGLRSLDEADIPIELPAGEVHVWHAGLELPEVRWRHAAASLAPDECQRAARFHFERHRRRFVAGRGLLRQILGAYLGIAAGEVRLARTTGGKPCLAKRGPGLAFNLSHADGLAVVAVTRDQEVGIDVERVRPVADLLGTAGRHFSAQELDHLARLGGTRRRTAFFRVWTCKEAWLKASGVGLALPPARVEVAVADSGPARLVAVAGDARAVGRWSLRELRPRPGYVAAVVVGGCIDRCWCRAWRWRDSGARDTRMIDKKWAGVGMSRSALRAGVVIAVSLAGMGAPRAAEVRPGGALDLTISGFAAMLAHGGALDNQREDPDLSTSLDFSTDVEVHVLARGTDEATGLEYGAAIELEADTNSTANADETWLFVSGGFGEMRFGDAEGPVDESVIGGQTIAGGTGGIDGDVVDELAIGIVQPTTSGTSTKVRYYTPDFAGFQFGVSYAPNDDDGGDTIATTDAELTDWLEATATYEGELAGIGVIASAIGGLATVKDEAAYAGGDRLWTWFAGVAAYLDTVELGAGYGAEDAGGLERRYANLGAGLELGPVYASLTGGRVLDTDNYVGVGKPWNVVLSADLELMPGLVLGGDVAWFENDLDQEAREPTGGDSGLVWVTRLEVVF